jgi:hypothetical protein
MQTLDEINHKRLQKRFHVLLRQLNHEGFTSTETFALVKKSPMDMDIEELMETCLAFERVLNPKMPETETMRKKTIDSIGAWLELYGKEKNIEAAKIIACGESGMRFFDEIPINKLRGIYRDFRRKRKEFLSIEKVISESINSYNSSGPKQAFYEGQKLHDG